MKRNEIYTTQTDCVRTAVGPLKSCTAHTLQLWHANLVRGGAGALRFSTLLEAADFGAMESNVRFMYGSIGTREGRWVSAGASRVAGDGTTLVRWFELD